MNISKYHGTYRQVEAIPSYVLRIPGQGFHNHEQSHGHRLAELPTPHPSDAPHNPQIA
jgi:tRNA(His) 5'-end guanylyltransferase